MPAPEGVASAPAPAAAAEPAASEEQAAAAPDKAATPGFDAEALPLSQAELGEFPFFSIPDGYWTPRPRQQDFGQAAFWTGDRFEIVEGRVQATEIRADSKSGKQFSALEVVRNLEHAIGAAGGVKVFSGTVPREHADDQTAAAAMRGHGAGAVCYSPDPFDVHVVRRTDGNVWVRICQMKHSVGLLLVQAKALVPTSALLPASALKQQLDADGKVAVQVNFASGKADILPESQPQIAQILALLQNDPALALSIEGHTDNTGDAAHNQQLSQQRAAAVAAALTSQGMDGARLSATGFGQDRPVADNATEEGRARNRRVELVRR